MADEGLVRYRFDGFDLFPAQKSLWRDGVRVPLTPKSVETLVLLVEHAGETVTKEDLMAQVWNGAAVEDNNLTQSISVLRKTLGEKRGENRFIVTEPGRGYRFVASVKAGPEPPAPPTEAPLPPTIGPRIAPNGRRHLSRRMLAISVVSLALLPVALVWVLRPIVHGRGPKNVVVLRFREIDGPPETAWLGTALSEVIQAQLSSSGKLHRIVLDSAARSRLGLAQPDPVLLSPVDLTRLRQISAADLVVAGSYTLVRTSESKTYRVDAQIYDTHSGQVIGSAAETGDEQSLFAMMSRVADQIGQQVGVKTLATSGVLAQDAKNLSKIDYARTLSLKAQFMPAGPDQEALYRQALDTGAKEGSGAWEIIPLTGLAKIFASRKDFENSADYFRRSFEVSMASNGPDDATTIEVEIGWARARARINQETEAVAQLQDGVSRAQRSASEDPDWLWTILHDAIHGCNEAKDFQDAESYTRMALALNERMHLPPTSEHWGMLYWDLGRAKRGEKQYEEAIAAFQKAKISFQFPDSRIDQVDRDIEVTKAARRSDTATHQ